MNAPNRFTKKPVTIEAMRLYMGEANTIADWVTANGGWARVGDYGNCVWIATPEGTMTAGLGDWIIRGVKGEFYPCKPDVFEATYGQADDALPTDIPVPAGPAGGGNLADAVVAVVVPWLRTLDEDETLALCEAIDAKLPPYLPKSAVPADNGFAVGAFLNKHTPGMVGIVAERRRQIETESFDALNDDDYDRDELVGAALSYLWPHWFGEAKKRAPISWPWEARWYKPKNRRRDLERAGALIAAELARMDRAEAGKDGAA